MGGGAGERRQADGGDEPVGIDEGGGKVVISFNFHACGREKPGGAIFFGSSRAVVSQCGFSPAHARKLFSSDAFGTAWGEAAARAARRAMPKGH